MNNGQAMTFNWCPAGTYQKGGVYKTEVIHANGFWIAKHEVTQGQYEKIMLENPSAWKNEFAPVSDVDLAKCKEFCSKITQNEQAAGRLPAGWEYRLPSASQWEYACRAGSTTKYAHGDDVARLVDYAWTRVNSGFKAHEVGQKLANPWGHPRHARKYYGIV